MSSSYKSFTLNDPGDPEPWATTEQDLFKDIIQTLVMGCCSEARDTSGHKHYRLHDPAGSNAEVIVDSSGNTVIGTGLATADGQLHVYKGSAGTVATQSGADTVVIESDDDAGMGFLIPTNKAFKLQCYPPGGSSRMALVFDINNEKFKIVMLNAGLGEVDALGVFEGAPVEAKFGFKCNASSYYYLGEEAINSNAADVQVYGNVVYDQHLVMYSQAGTKLYIPCCDTDQA